MDISAFFAAAIGAILAVLGAGAALFSRRRAKMFESLSKSSTFHCLHCDCVYVSKRGDDIADCPKCGYKNPKLKF
ncbi:MAG: hypothetical protein IJI37_03035 [Opitutales bacterium]|nr:hypothetical protein [Opitutales bacterium]